MSSFEKGISSVALVLLLGASLAVLGHAPAASGQEPPQPAKNPPVAPAAPSGPATSEPARSAVSVSDSPGTPQRAVIVTIKDEINDITLASMKRRVEEARTAGMTMIVFEMDTPGGLASSALEICTYIKNVSDMKTVAWVEPAAYSAGAMIALACNEIVMSRASKIGDCAPILISPTEGLKELGKTERAKAESPILKEFRDSAHRGHYDLLMCESMVRLGNEIWWMENGPSGERRFVLERDKDALAAEEGSAWRPVRKMLDPVSKTELEVRQPIVEERDLLTLTQSEAVAYGFAKAIVSTEGELRTHYGITGEIIRHVPNWAEIIADFLSSPIVRTVLMMLIALGAYAEFQAPGHFVGAGVAVVALIIFLGAPYLTGLADVWEILLVLLGVILLAVEIFVIPGFGVAGILGIVLILIGLIATFVPAEPGPVIVPRMPGTWLGLKTGIQVVFGGMALSLVGMWLLNKYLPQIPGARGLILPPARPTTPAEAGLAGAHSPASALGSGPSAYVQLGDTGKTLTKLRPAGKAHINGRRLDVIAQGQMIEEGVRVEVVEIEGVRIVVREVRQV
jgi:membrane-bound serine protease (ClpP class)